MQHAAKRLGTGRCAGATILESTGLVRAQMGMRDDLPLMPSLSDLEEKDEVRHRTLFSVVNDMETVERVKRITEKVVGPLEEENTGFMFVVPVTVAYGIHRQGRWQIVATLLHALVPNSGVWQSQTP